MTVCRRVILILQFNDGVLFRTKRFVPDYRYTQSFSWSGDADELVFLDITRRPTGESRLKFLKILEKYCRVVDIPMISGGGIRNLAMARENLNCGSEAVVVGWGGKSIYEEVAGRFGSQALIAGVDYDYSDVQSGQAVVKTDQNTRSVQDGLAEVCQEAESLGAGQILLASIDRDGSLSGFDCAEVARLRAVIKVPFIVAGGCGNWSHIRQVFEAGADGAATSNVFHWSETAMRACKTWLKANYDGPIREAA